MKSLARVQTLPPTLAALERAFATDGVSALEPNVPPAVWQRALVDPAADFLARPGKELRSSLVQAGWCIGGGAPDAMPPALPLVIELLHAGSLIIDDVEDGALERRGAPALHHVVGTPLAINTGSWMYFWALAELAAAELPPAAELAAHRLAATTLVRCHQGQALDLATRIADLAPAEVPAVVAATTQLKTGALCRFAAELGAIAAGATEPARAAIARFAEAMGSGLQMLDDLSSLVVPARRAKAREDLVEQRPTWPWAWVAEQGPFVWNPLASLSRGLVAGLVPVDELADALAIAIGDLGRARVRTTLDGALANLIAAIDDPTVTALIARELARMEASYG